MQAHSLTLARITNAPLDGEAIIARAEHDGGVRWVTNYGRAGCTYERFQMIERQAGARLTDDIISAIWFIYENPSAGCAAQVVIDEHRAEARKAAKRADKLSADRSRITCELDVKRKTHSALAVAFAGLTPITEGLGANAECMSFSACNSLVDTVLAIDDARIQVAREISELEAKLSALDGHTAR